MNVFRRQSFGLRIALLIRSSRSKESKVVLADLAEGRTDIVIGTHAVANARSRDLGLVMIDEEQRFGEAQKRALGGSSTAAFSSIRRTEPG